MNKEELKQENKKLKETISQFSEMDLRYMTPQGSIKMIKWGEDYQHWDVNKRLEYAEALASAMNEACRIIQNERNEWLSISKGLEKQLEQAKVQIDNHIKNNINSITKSNSDKQELIKTIRRLENELLAANKKNEELIKDLHIATLNS